MKSVVKKNSQPPQEFRRVLPGKFKLPDSPHPSLAGAERAGHEPGLAHSRTLNALPHILGAQRQGDTDYLEGCRQKRNTVEYDYAGGASRSEAEELIAFGQELRAEVLAWLQKKHPSLVPERDDPATA